jgi:lysozyme
MWMQETINRIKQHEGYRDTIYTDSLGYNTIGYGHLVVEDGFVPGVQYSKAELEKVFEKDFAIAVEDANKLVGSFGIVDVAFGVVVEMCFQLGLPRVSKFIKFLDALKNKDYERAADEMLDSAWHRQTPGRCQELSNIIRKCQE